MATLNLETRKTRLLAHVYDRLLEDAEVNYYEWVDVLDAIQDVLGHPRHPHRLRRGGWVQFPPRRTGLHRQGVHKVKKLDKDFLIFLGIVAVIIGLVVVGFMIRVAIWRHFLCG